MPPDASQLQNRQLGGGSAASIFTPVALAVVLIRASC